MNGRSCNKCKIWKEAINLGKQKNTKDGLYSICKLCKKEYRDNRKLISKEWHKQYYIENKEKISKRNKKWQINNKDKTKITAKNWRQNNKEKVNARKRRQYHKWKHNPVYNTQIRLRNRLRAAIKANNWRKDNTFTKVIGCDKETLMNRLEKQFVIGMNWDNRNLWHIDHITPLASAETIEDINRLSHYTNLQPLWAKDNIIKGDKCPNL